MPDRTPRRAATARRGLRWWTDRSSAARLELITHGVFHSYSLGLGAATAVYLLPGFDEPSADVAVALLLLAHGVLGGLAASQALRWEAGRRSRPTALMATVAATAGLVLLLVLHQQTHEATGNHEIAAEQAGTALYAIGSTMVPVAVLTVRALPALRIAGLVAATVAVVTAASAAAGLPGVVLFVNGWLAFWFGCAAIFVTRLSAWGMRIVWELLEARDTRAQLAVAEERLRFARDLHDVMGRNLSVVALKSELAAQLVRRGATDAAVDELDEMQRMARETQTEVRAVVRGYREADLATELAGARGVLESAGIDCDIVTPDIDPDPDSDPDGHGAASLAPSVQAALGWVVREATTNVLRHADAASCEIRLRAAAAETVLTVTNDGVPASPEAGARSGAAAGGTGLAGLRERLAALGGTLNTRARNGTFVLTASVPGHGKP
ncbi:histidine kinase [Streptomyces sp. B6B3]|uniref:sensor histidine kinase n=1 Tax=Streptomyces sp. B6B3 TaxID=3153570 RepID=UPI00325C89F6